MLPNKLLRRAIATGSQQFDKICFVVLDISRPTEAARVQGRLPQKSERRLPGREWQTHEGNSIFIAGVAGTVLATGIAAIGNAAICVLPQPFSLLFCCSL